MHDSDLEDLFRQARADAPLPSPGLFARIEADALAEQGRRAVPARPAPRHRWPGWIGALGGRGVLAGLAAATFAGIWLGAAQPAPVATLTQTVIDAIATDTVPDEVELIPTLDAFVLEG